MKQKAKNLALKYRPQRFAEVVGQGQAVKILRTLAGDRRDLRVVLLSGQRGIGKTSLARLYGKLLNCEAPSAQDPCGSCKSCTAFQRDRHPDCTERDFGSSGLVADARRLKEEALIKPAWKSRVFILDEIHSGSREAFNALLSLLEEPPPKAHFAMCTTEPTQVPYTIISRSLHLELIPLNLALVTRRLAVVCEKEKIEKEDRALELISKKCGGSLRDAYMMLERIALAGDGVVSEATIKSEGWFVSVEQSKQLIVSILKKERHQFEEVLSQISSIVMYENILQEALRRLSEYYISKGKRQDLIINALWRAYVRVKQGVDPELALEGLWYESVGPL